MHDIYQSLLSEWVWNNWPSNKPNLDLSRIRPFLNAFDNPERAVPPIVHIAGTNGKGSVLAMLRAGMKARGQTAHSFVSPHLIDMRERFTIANAPITPKHLVDLILECRACAQKHALPITHFEALTVIAFLAFSRTPADWTLLEVGLGGRLDATNVIEKPALTIITPVSLDHAHILGPDVATIATEKAGILKPNVPCVVAMQDPTALTAIKRIAKDVNAPLFIAGEHWQVDTTPNGFVWCDKQTNKTYTLPPPNLCGAHQIDNAAVVIAALSQLGFSEQHCAMAISQAHWPGRLQRLQSGIINHLVPNSDVWLDGGHNPSAGAALAAFLSTLPKQHTDLVCAIGTTKDWANYIKPLLNTIDGTVYCVPIGDEYASYAPYAMADIVTVLGGHACTHQHFVQALLDCRDNAPNGRIVLCGSLYFAAQVLRALV